MRKTPFQPQANHNVRAQRTPFYSTEVEEGDLMTEAFHYDAYPSIRTTTESSRTTGNRNTTIDAAQGNRGTRDVNSRMDGTEPGTSQIRLPPSTAANHASSGISVSGIHTSNAPNANNSGTAYRTSHGSETLITTLRDIWSKNSNEQQQQQQQQQQQECIPKAIPEQERNHAEDTIVTSTASSSTPHSKHSSSPLFTSSSTGTATQTPPGPHPMLSSPNDVMYSHAEHAQHPPASTNRNCTTTTGLHCDDSHVSPSSQPSPDPRRFARRTRFPLSTSPQSSMSQNSVEDVQTDRRVNPCDRFANASASLPVFHDPETLPVSHLTPLASAACEPTVGLDVPAAPPFQQMSTQQGRVSWAGKTPFNPSRTSMSSQQLLSQGSDEHTHLSQVHPTHGTHNAAAPVNLSQNNISNFCTPFSIPSSNSVVSSSDDSAVNLSPPTIPRGNAVTQFSPHASSSLVASEVPANVNPSSGNRQETFVPSGVSSSPFVFKHRFAAVGRSHKHRAIPNATPVSTQHASMSTMASVPVQHAQSLSTGSTDSAPFLAPTNPEPRSFTGLRVSNTHDMVVANAIFNSATRLANALPLPSTVEGTQTSTLLESTSPSDSACTPDPYIVVVDDDDDDEDDDGDDDGNECGNARRVMPRHSVHSSAEDPILIDVDDDESNVDEASTPSHPPPHSGQRNWYDSIDAARKPGGAQTAPHSPLPEDQQVCNHLEKRRRLSSNWTELPSMLVKRNTKASSNDSPPKQQPRQKSPPHQRPAAARKSNTNRSCSTSSDEESSGVKPGMIMHSKKEMESWKIEAHEKLTENLTSEQKRVWKRVVYEGRSVFITGGAGTGKSYLLKSIIAALPMATTFVTATTGIAALDLSGTTLHSFAGCGIVDPYKDTHETVYHNASRNKKVVEKWRQCQVLIIDEVSMLDGWLFEALEVCARRIRQSIFPFGGIQLVATGDFLQLPPVNKPPTQGSNMAPKLGPGNNGLFQITMRLAFETQAWARVNPLVCVLKQQQRQKDSYFFNILNGIRHGETSVDAIRELRDCSSAFKTVDTDPVPSNGAAIPQTTVNSPIGAGKVNTTGGGVVQTDGTSNEEVFRGKNSAGVVTDACCDSNGHRQPHPHTKIEMDESQSTANPHSPSPASDPVVEEKKEKMYVRLRALRRAVDTVNEVRFTQLSTPIYQYFGVHRGQGSFPDALPDVVSLREGCKVMLIKNINLPAGLGNGTIGTVVGFVPVTEAHYNKMPRYVDASFDVEIMAYASIYNSDRFSQMYHEGARHWREPERRRTTLEQYGTKFRSWVCVQPRLPNETRYGRASNNQNRYGRDGNERNGKAKFAPDQVSGYFYPKDQLAPPPQLDSKGRIVRTSLMLPIVEFNVRRRDPKTNRDVAVPEAVIIGPQHWSQMEGDAEVSCSLQIPLRLAYAITIHKSQGMSLSHVNIDFDGIFEKGQAYVALSRCTTLPNLIVDNFKVDYVLPNTTALAYYYAVRTYQRHMRQLRQTRHQEKKHTANENALLAPAPDRADSCAAIEDVRKPLQSEALPSNPRGGVAWHSKLKQMAAARQNDKRAGQGKQEAVAPPSHEVQVHQIRKERLPPWGSSTLHNFSPPVIRVTMREDMFLPLVFIDKPEAAVHGSERRPIAVPQPSRGDPTEDEEEYLMYDPAEEMRGGPYKGRVDTGRFPTESELHKRLQAATTRGHSNHDEPRQVEPRGAPFARGKKVTPKTSAAAQPSERNPIRVESNASKQNWLASSGDGQDPSDDELYSRDEMTQGQSFMSQVGMGRSFTSKSNAEVYESDVVAACNDTTQIERLRRLFDPVFASRAGMRRRVLSNIQSAFHAQDALLVTDLSSLALLASPTPILIEGTGNSSSGQAAARLRSTSSVYKDLFQRNNNMMRISTSLKHLLMSVPSQRASNSASSSSGARDGVAVRHTEDRKTINMYPSTGAAKVSGADDQKNLKASFMGEGSKPALESGGPDKSLNAKQHSRSSSESSCSTESDRGEDGYDELKGFVKLLNSWSAECSQADPANGPYTQSDDTESPEHSSVPLTPPCGMTLSAEMAANILSILDSAQRDLVLDEQRPDEFSKDYDPLVVTPGWEPFIPAIEHVKPCHPYVHDMLSYALFLGERYASVVVVMTESVEVATRASWLGLPVCSIDYLCQHVHMRC